MFKKLKRFLPTIEIVRTAPTVETVDDALRDLSRARDRLSVLGMQHSKAAQSQREAADRSTKAAIVAEGQAARCWRVADKINDLIG